MVYYRHVHTAAVGTSGVHVLVDDPLFVCNLVSDKTGGVETAVCLV